MVQLLDELEKTDPESYRQLVAAMQQQLQAAGVAPGGAPTPTPTDVDTDTALLDMLKQTAARAGGDISTARPPSSGECARLVAICCQRVMDSMWCAHVTEFAPKFPGDRVMDADGIKPKTEGVRDRNAAAYGEEDGSNNTRACGLGADAH